MRREPWRKLMKSDQMSNFFKPKPITEQSFELFPKLHNWTPYKIPNIYWPKMTFLPRHEHLIEVFGSGCQTTQVNMNGLLVSAGLDAIAYEPHPQSNTKYGQEPYINIYHIMFQKLRTPRDGLSYLC